MSNSDGNKAYIDIEKIIRESEWKVLKRLPGFVVRWLTAIIRQDEMNRILSRYSHDTGKEFLVKIIAELNLNLEIEGKENLPENGKCFFVANHPFGVIDGLILTHIVSEKYGHLKAIANDAFMFMPQLRPMIAAVNVFDRSSREYVLALQETYHSELPITHFPSGEVSRIHKGKIQDIEWQKSFISKAIECKRAIVPIRFYGRNSILFYTLHKVRRFLGIELNIELILLPRELFKKRNKTIRVRIGKPIPYSIFDRSMTSRGWAQKVRSQVYEN